MKTIPRQRSIHKLFTSFTTSPFGSARPYGEEIFLTSWFKDFTLANTSAKNPISSVVDVLNASLIFACKTIIQRLKSFLDEDAECARPQALEFDSRERAGCVSKIQTCSRQVVASLSSRRLNPAGIPARSIKSVEIPSGESRLIPTGIAIELPPQTEAQIRPRSGLALKHQITVLNTPGTIDRGYRGEIGVILINHGNKTFRVTRGMRIAQMVIAPVIRVKIEESEKLDTTTRNTGGFGSTNY